MSSKTEKDRLKQEMANTLEEIVKLMPNGDQLFKAVEIEISRIFASNGLRIDPYTFNAFIMGATFIHLKSEELKQYGISMARLMATLMLLEKRSKEREKIKEEMKK